MPHRHLTALPLALAATAAMAAGCSIEVSPDAVDIPVPFSVAPTPSASAGVPKYVCTTAYRILTDGAVSLARFMSSSGDTARQGLHDTLTGMATQFRDEAARTTEPGLKQALGAVADDLTAGAGQPDPRAYAEGGFATVGQKLDRACADV